MEKDQANQMLQCRRADYVTSEEWIQQHIQVEAYLHLTHSAANLGVATAVRIQYKVGTSSTLTATFPMRIVTDLLPSTFLVLIPSFYHRDHHTLSLIH